MVRARAEGQTGDHRRWFDERRSEMFTTLDPTLAYGRREEMAREVSSARLENRSRAARGGRRGGRWSLRMVRMLRAPANANAEAARVGHA